MRAIMLLPAMILAALFTTPAARADSFAAAYGDNEYGNPRQDYEWCRRANLEDAKLCALRACEGAHNDECDFTIWCEPAKWSGVLAMKTGDGVKYFAVCEKASRNSALRALKNECKAFQKTHRTSFASCKVESLVSPNADTSDTNVVTWKYRNGDIRAVD